MSQDLLPELRQALHERRIGFGIELLERNRPMLAGIRPDQPCAGRLLGCLAQWIDVGFEDGGLLERTLEHFPRPCRQALPLADFIYVLMAEAVMAMRRENLTDALRHLDSALAICDQVEDVRIAVIANLWKARCLRKAGEYDQALQITRHGRNLATHAGLPFIGAVIATVESWLLFQKGNTNEAVAILQASETCLRDTDDFITLGNIQSTYGRIALREGRYDHALKYFASSIDLFKRRGSLRGYLARSLTNIAQAKRFLAWQLRRSIDAVWERGRRGLPADSSNGNGKQNGKAGQLERMHSLLREAQSDLAQADVIYKQAQNHHGAGNVDVNLAQIYLDLGNVDQADERATEAFDLAASKADYLLMSRARIVQAMVANARFEDQIGEAEDPSRFAQLAHDCAQEAVDLAKRTESRRLLAQANICLGTALINGFFNDTEAARGCCDRAETLLNDDRKDALWHELELLRANILRSGLEDPNLRAWSQGAIGDKSLQDVVGEFEELLIRKVWENEGRKVSRVARRLAVSPKKVRRVLRRLGLLLEHA